MCDTWCTRLGRLQVKTIKTVILLYWFCSVSVHFQLTLTSKKTTLFLFTQLSIAEHYLAVYSLCFPLYIMFQVPVCEWWLDGWQRLHGGSGQAKNSMVWPAVMILLSFRCFASFLKCLLLCKTNHKPLIFRTLMQTDFFKDSLYFVPYISI